MNDSIRQEAQEQKIRETIAFLHSVIQSRERYTPRVKQAYDEGLAAATKLRARCDQQARGIEDAIGFVRTGGPLYSKDRLELLDILSASLTETEGAADV